MDEARRFLRYVTPGLVFGVHTAVLLAAVDPRAALGNAILLKGDQGLGVAVTLFLVTGGLGYLFSVLHHTWHHAPWVRVLDHRRSLADLVRAGLLSLRLVHGKQLVWALLPSRKIDAWVITESLWSQRLEKSPILKAADSAACALLDATHAAGAARVAALFALPAAGVLAAFAQVPDPPVLTNGRFALGTVIGTLLFVMHYWNYHRTGRLAEALIAECLADALRDEIGERSSREALIREKLGETAAKGAVDGIPETVVHFAPSTRWERIVKRISLRCSKLWGRVRTTLRGFRGGFPPVGARGAPVEANVSRLVTEKATAESSTPRPRAESRGRASESRPR